jgi:hypothetical protein
VSELESEKARQERRALVEEETHAFLPSKFQINA